MEEGDNGIYLDVLADKSGGSAEKGGDISREDGQIGHDDILNISWWGTLGIDRTTYEEYVNGR